MQAWLLLAIAGVFEICWAVGLKMSDGFTKTGPAAFTVVTLALSMIFLGLAARTLPIGTAYAVWTGIGAAGTVFAGYLLLNEALTPARLVCIGLILAGIVGLKLLAPEAA